MYLNCLLTSVSVLVELSFIIIMTPLCHCLLCKVAVAAEKYDTLAFIYYPSLTLLFGCACL